MEHILHLIEHHGYLALIVMVFLEAIGLPIPAAIALVAAGAAAAWRTLALGYVIALAILPIIIGDSILYFLGRESGWALLGILCRVSMNPETCILRSAESFYKRGRITLLFAKFIPGVNTMAPPLAGSMKMRLRQFLLFDAGGATLYVLAYACGGFAFSKVIRDVAKIFETVGHAVTWIIGLAFIVYLGYRFYIYWKHRAERVVPRVQVGELERRLDAGEDLRILDVRSHGYYDAGSLRIRGSARFEPNNFDTAVKALPKDQLIFLYCT
jgi:membrane protein DedA with SNARE-associated domain